MKRLTVYAFLVMALSSLAAAQSNSGTVQNGKCTVPLAKAPELRGFRLGMSQERVLARFPGISLDRADEFGRTKVKLTFMSHEDYPGGSVGRDRGVQIDIAAGTTDGKSFLVDSSRFPELKGLTTIRLRFIDGRISYLQMGYDDSIAWIDSDEFARVISKPLGLDGNWQRVDDSDTKEKQLPCDGFLARAGLGGDAGDYHVGARLSLEDTGAARMLEKRQSDQAEKLKRQEEERRKAFKP